MSKKRNLIFICLLILGILLLTSCFLKPPVTEGILKGQVIVPEGTLQAKDLTGQALPNATVNIIDPATGEIIATTTTDTNGYYQVFVPAGGPYLLQAVKDGVKLLQFTPLVEVGIEYDLGTADCSTTTIALIAQAMMDAEDYPDDLADINLTEIATDPNFNDVMSIVCSTIEDGEDPTLSAVVQQAVEDFLSPSAPIPTPTPTTTYTVTFDSQGGSAVGSQTVAHGGKVTEPTAPTRTGYTFGGWYKESGCTTAWNFATDTVTSDVTLYAKWTSSATEIISYKFEEDENEDYLSFDITGTIDSVNHTVSLIVLYGADVTNLVATFTLSGGASAKVVTTPQTSKVTPNNFTSPVVYTITAEDGTTTQDWTVTVVTIDRYVATAANGGADSNDGSESTPWLTIQHALDTTPHLGTIFVKVGIYNESIEFPADKMVILKNATGATPTIRGISGQPTVAFIGYWNWTSTIEGFIITHAGVVGRGIYIGGGRRVNIINCTISNNMVSDSDGGGGIWLDESNNDVTLTDCTISNNMAGFAGGIYDYGVNNQLTLDNCTITGNEAFAADGKGGGVYIDGPGVGSVFDIIDCTISGNYADYQYSAGVYLWGAVYGDIEGNTICGNYITGSSPTLGDQIGNGYDSLHASNSYINDICVDCACDSATLSALSLSTGTLAPTFACATISYTATVANATTSITVTPTVNCGGATVTVNGVSVASGSASGAISLDVGGNTITIIVSDTKTYTVIVNRALAIGDSYGGGIVAYILQTGDPGYDANVQHGLIAATADQSTGIQWYNGSYVVTGAIGTAIGTGQANTTAIVTIQGAGSYAAKLCNDLTVGDYSDWFFPSKDELEKLYTNKAAIGGFADSSLSYYWSSSEVNNMFAWSQNYSSGNQINGTKSDTAHVRAVRAF